MSTLNIYISADVDGNQQAKLDQRSPGLSVTLTNGVQYHIENVTVADNFGTANLWQTGIGGLTTFEVGCILSTQDIFLQLRSDHSTPEYTLLKVPANVPVFFGGQIGGSTTDRVDGAALVADTDYADVDDIQVQRDAADDSGDAVVDLWLWS